MDVYALNEEQLKKYEKEFYATAYGKRMKNARNSAFVSMAIFVVIMILKSVFSGDGVTSAITDGIFWLGVLVADSVEAFINFKCNREIKEYVRKKKDA